MRRAKAEARRTGWAARVYTEFRYRTRDSWSRARRVVVLMASAYPYRAVFAHAWIALRC